jgi:hypothetical protein
VDLLLTEAEIVALTGLVRHKAQARELEFQGIPYKLRRNGSLIVYRIHTAYATQEKQEQSPSLCLP